MNSYQLEELIKNIQKMIRCPNCGNSYKKENINFLGQLGQAVLVQLNCLNCKMPVMATIVMTPGITSNNSLPDISSFKELEDLYKNLPAFSNRKEKMSSPELSKPISSDEILDFHEFLENFDGDFNKLFNK